MKEGKKIYSLLLKAESGDYYRVKIEDDYRNPLAVIDAYTVDFADKDALCGHFSYALQADIVDAKIIYQKDGKSKALEPIFADMKELGEMAKIFGKHSLVAGDDHKSILRIVMFAKKLMADYWQSPLMKQSFDEKGDYIVGEALRNNDETTLIRRLYEYRKLRKSVILKNKIELGEDINVYPMTTDLSNANIIKSEARHLELVEKEIDKVQRNISDDVLIQQAMALRLEELYKEREELILNLGVKEDKNHMPGQTKMMF